MNVKPGDIVFYPDDGNWKHSIFAKLQEWGGELGSWAGKPITHVGMISTEPDLMIDMKWPRPRFSFFADDVREKIVMRPACDEAIRLRAIYWCYFHINEHYSFADMVLGKFGAVHSYKICSGWVSAAYKEAGFPLVRFDDKLVSPHELISSRWLREVTE